MVKNSPASAGEMWVPSLGQDDSLEEGIVTHSNILLLENPLGTEKPGGLQFKDRKELDMTEVT